MIRVQISLRVPETLKARLKVEASRREVTVSSLASSILREGLTIYEDQEVVVRRKFEILLEPQEVGRLEDQGFVVVEMQRKRGPKLPVFTGPQT